MQVIPYDVRQSTRLYEVNRLSNVRWYELPISPCSYEIRSITRDPPYQVLGILSACHAHPDEPRTEGHNPEELSIPTFCNQTDELLCIVFIKIGDRCLSIHKFYYFMKAKYLTNLSFFMLRRGRTFRHLVNPHPVLRCHLNGCISLLLQIGFL